MNKSEIPKHERKVLIVSYVFPPMAAVGGYRIIKFCKFLPRFQWIPVVLTVKKGFNYAYDYSLLDCLDPSLKVYRSPNLEPLVWWDRRSSMRSTGGDKTTGKNPRLAEAETTGSQLSLGNRIKNFVRKLISIPDTCNFWIPLGILTGLRAARKEKVDIIFSTSPPASSHLVAYAISKLTGLPLVSDLRDLWTQNESYEIKNLPGPLRSFDRFLEKVVFKRARTIITTTETFTAMVRAKNPFKENLSVKTITNGLDRDDFTGIIFPTTKNDKFTILHLGSLYGNRNPEFFFKATRHWLNSKPAVRENVTINFIGNAPGFEQQIEAEGLVDIVKFKQHIPHARVLEKLWEADLLLLILGFNDSVSGVIPAKLFEYISTGRPILGLVPNGEAERIIGDFQRGKVITNPNLDETWKFLDDQYNNWKDSPRDRKSMFNLPPEFDRRHQSEKLAKILGEIA